MSRGVVLIAAGVAILAGVAWGAWRAEQRGAGPTDIGKAEPRAAAEDSSRLGGAQEAAPARGRSSASLPAASPVREAPLPPGGEALQELPASRAARASPAVLATRKALRDPSPEVRRSAVRELVRLDDRDAVRALTRLARRDPSPEVRAAAQEGLRDLGAEEAVAEGTRGEAGPDDPVQRERTPRYRPRLPEDAQSVDYDSMPMQSLVALLSSQDLGEREAAIDALRYNEHYAAIPDLWDAFFREPDWDTRDFVLDALEDMGQEVDEMRELLYLSDETEVDWERLRATLR